MTNSHNKIVEVVSDILRSRGQRNNQTPKKETNATYHLNNFVTEFVADEGRFAQAAEALGTTPRKMLADGRKHFSALPKDQYPNIVELAGDLAKDDADGLFQFVFQIWLRAIEHLSRARS